jgi:hypothetical protein
MKQIRGEEIKKAYRMSVQPDVDESFWQKATHVALQMVGDSLACYQRVFILLQRAFASAILQLQILSGHRVSGLVCSGSHGNFQVTSIPRRGIRSVAGF